MGGTVKVESELGQGTTFSITQVLKVKCTTITSCGMFQQSEAFNEIVEQEDFEVNSGSYWLEDEPQSLEGNHALVVNDEHFILVCIN